MDEVLKFWSLDQRAGAVFEGKLIGPEDIKKDPKMAQRYLDKQLKACFENWKVQHSAVEWKNARR